MQRVERGFEVVPTVTAASVCGGEISPDSGDMSVENHARFVADPYAAGVLTQCHRNVQSRAAGSTSGIPFNPAGMPPAPGRRLNRSLCKADLVNVEIVTRKKVHMVLTQRFERAPQDLAHNLAHESEQTEMELVERTCDTFHSGHQTSCAWLCPTSIA